MQATDTRPKPRLIIVRGLPGAGKTTYVKREYPDILHMELDMFRVVGGVYCFDATAQARQLYNRYNTVLSIIFEQGCDVVVSNTATTLKEFKPLIEEAETKGYTTEVLRLLSEFKSIHAVPDEVVERMQTRWEDYPGEKIVYITAASDPITWEMPQEEALDSLKVQDMPKQEYYTTFARIQELDPCMDGWNKLLQTCNPKTLTAEVSLMQILESNGIRDAIWALRCWEYLDYCLFLADLAEYVLPIFEEVYPDNPRPRQALEAIREYHREESRRRQRNDTSGSQRVAVAYTRAHYIDATACLGGWYAEKEKSVLQYATKIFPNRGISLASWGAMCASESAQYLSAASFAAEAIARASAVDALGAATCVAKSIGVDNTDSVLAGEHTRRGRSPWQVIEMLFVKHFGGSRR